MKIGILAQYLDSRNDVRELIRRLSVNFEVIVFLRPPDIHQSEYFPDLEVREIQATNPRNINNLIWKYLFQVLGRIPKSRRNYYLTERTKLMHKGIPASFRIEKKITLFLSRILPNFITYDKYIRNIRHRKETKIDDIDFFLCTSELYDHNFFSHIHSAGIPAYMYIYSWDHPCKMKTYPAGIKGYFVWNDGLKDDLIQLHNLDGEKINVVGSTQLSTINDLQPEPRHTSIAESIGQYIYFGCAFGHPVLAIREVEYIKHLAVIIERLFPEMTFLVRPYPFMKSWSVYDELKDYPNIKLDKDLRTEGSYDLSTDGIQMKIEFLKNAYAFIHLGTTLGFEAAYFDIPVFQIAYDHPGSGLKKYIYQYHIHRYLILEEFANVITDLNAMETELQGLKENRESYKEYSRAIQNSTPIRSLDDIVSNLTSYFPGNGIQD